MGICKLENLKGNMSKLRDWTAVRYNTRSRACLFSSKETELCSGAIKRKQWKLTVKDVLVPNMFQQCADLIRIKLDSHRGTSWMYINLVRNHWILNWCTSTWSNKCERFHVHHVNTLLYFWQPSLIQSWILESCKVNQVVNVRFVIYFEYNPKRTFWY